MPKKIQITNPDQLGEAYQKITRKRKPRSDAEEDERLSILGQESEKKAVKWIKEDVAETDHLEQEKKWDELEYLIYKRKFTDEEYLTVLGAILQRRLKEVDWPLGYHFRVVIEGKHMKVEVITPTKRVYAKGIAVSGEPKYDHHAVKIMAIEAENTVEDLEKTGEGMKTKGGIYLS